MNESVVRMFDAVMRKLEIDGREVEYLSSKRSTI